MNNLTEINLSPLHLFLHQQAKDGKIKAYFARNEKMEAKVKFCTEGKPTYINHPYSEALTDCAEYVEGGYRKLYHAGIGYHAH